MSQSLVKNLLHLVYSTKHRQAWIPVEVRPRLYAYQSGIFKEWESPALAIGGVEDHVHALFSLSRNHALKRVIEEVKKGSSKWMKREGTGNTDFYWQNGYAAFSGALSRPYRANRRELDLRRPRNQKPRNPGRRCALPWADVLRPRWGGYFLPKPTLCPGLLCCGPVGADISCLNQPSALG